MVSSLRPPENRKSNDVIQSGVSPSSVPRRQRYNQAKIDRLKFILVIINTFLFIFGAITFGLSVVGVMRYKLLGYEETFASVTIVSVAPWIIAVSSTMSVTMVPLYGCYGAVAQRKNMLIMFFIYILSVLILDIGMVLWVVIGSDTIEENIAASLRSAVRDYSINTDNKRALDDLHKHFSCCGADHGVIDFGSRGPPATCAHEYLFEPCIAKMVTVYEMYRFKAMGAFGALAAILMVTLVLVISLLSAMRKWKPPRPPDRRRPEISVTDIPALAETPTTGQSSVAQPPSVVYSPGLARPPGMVRRSPVPRPPTTLHIGNSNESSCV